MESGNLKKLPIKQDIETKKVLKKLASVLSHLLKKALKF